MAAHSLDVADFGPGLLGCADPALVALGQEPVDIDALHPGCERLQGVVEDGWEVVSGFLSSICGFAEAPVGGVHPPPAVPLVRVAAPHVVRLRVVEALDVVAMEALRGNCRLKGIEVGAYAGVPAHVPAPLEDLRGLVGSVCAVCHAGEQVGDDPLVYAREDVRVAQRGGG